VSGHPRTRLLPPPFAYTPAGCSNASCGACSLSCALSFSYRLTDAQPCTHGCRRADAALGGPDLPIPASPYHNDGDGDGWYVSPHNSRQRAAEDHPTTSLVEPKRSCGQRPSTPVMVSAAYCSPVLSPKPEDTSAACAATSATSSAEEGERHDACAFRACEHEMTSFRHADRRRCVDACFDTDCMHAHAALDPFQRASAGLVTCIKREEGHGGCVPGAWRKVGSKLTYDAVKGWWRR